jgi:hypothetical protein
MVGPDASEEVRYLDHAPTPSLSRIERANAEYEAGPVDARKIVG